MIYLLDTDFVVFIIRGKNKPVGHALRIRAEKLIAAIEQIKESGSSLGISAITRAELEYGAEHANDPTKEHEALEKILAPFDHYDFDARNSSRIYGVVRSELERNGEIIGGMDLLIAAHAMSLRAVLVTNNVREYSRIPALKVENWS